MASAVPNPQSIGSHEAKETVKGLIYPVDYDATGSMAISVDSVFTCFLAS